MGSQNGSIYLFRVSRDGFSYKKINKIRGSQPLTHLDWSADGCYLQTVTVDFDLLFCMCAHMPSDSCYLDVMFETYNFLNCRGRQVHVSGAQPCGNEGRQVADAVLHSRLFGSGHLEQSILCDQLVDYHHQQSGNGRRYAGFRRCGRISALVQVQCSTFSMGEMIR